MTTHMTFQKAEALAAQNGITLTKTDRSRITGLQQAELTRLKALDESDSPQSKLDAFNARYPAMLDMVLNLGDISVSGAFTVLISFGAPALLLLLLAVEIWRVQHGIQMFDSTPIISLGVAVAIVGLNIVLEAVVHYKENQAGYEWRQAVEFSFANLWQRLKYIIGVGRDWQPKPKSPALRERRLLLLVSAGILLLATLGSMRGIIEAAPGVWYEALVLVGTGSTLADMMTWAAGLITAVIAVFGAQGVMRYLSDRVVEAVDKMRHLEQEQVVNYSDELEAVAVNYITAKIQQKGERADFLPMPQLNGNGNGNGHRHS